MQPSQMHYGDLLNEHDFVDRTSSWRILIPYATSCVRSVTSTELPPFLSSSSTSSRTTHTSAKSSCIQRPFLATTDYSASFVDTIPTRRNTKASCDSSVHACIMRFLEKCLNATVGYRSRWFSTSVHILSHAVSAQLLPKAYRSNLGSCMYVIPTIIRSTRPSTGSRQAGSCKHPSLSQKDQESRRSRHLAESLEMPTSP